MDIFLMILWIINCYLWASNIARTLILAVEWWEYLDKKRKFLEISWLIISTVMLILSGLQATWFMIKIWG